MLSPTTVMWILLAASVLLGVPFTLWWWKIGDQWADSEHKRFKTEVDTRERVVVKSPSPPTGDEPGEGGP